MRFLIVAGLAESLLNFRGELLMALAHRNIEIHVAAPGLKVGDKLRERLESLGYHVHNIPLGRTGTNPKDDLRTFISLLRIIVAIRPHYLLGYTVKPVVYGSIAGWVCRVPNRFALITGLGYAFQGSSDRNGVRRIVEGLYRFALARVKGVFFQNPDDRALFQARGILKDGVESVVVNGSGVDTKKFRYSIIPEGKLRFLLIARLLGDKGVREYALAAERVRSRFPHVQFALAGWIDESPDAIRESELEKWIADGSIEYLGRLTDVRPAIADCSVYVLPSYREGTPRTVLEAMAMGRAIITTDAPGCRETVVDKENGFLVPVKSVEALEEAMVSFVMRPELACEMGARSRAVAEERYDVHKVNAVMLREMGIL